MPGMAPRDDPAEFYMRLLEDVVIRERIVADSSLRAATEAAIQSLPVEHREHLLEMLRTPVAPRPASPSTPVKPRRDGTTPGQVTVGTRGRRHGPAE